MCMLLESHILSPAVMKVSRGPSEKDAKSLAAAGDRYLQAPAVNAFCIFWSFMCKSQSMSFSMLWPVFISPWTNNSSKQEEPQSKFTPPPQAPCCCISVLVKSDALFTCLARYKHGNRWIPVPVAIINYFTSFLTHSTDSIVLCKYFIS